MDIVLLIVGLAGLWLGTDLTIHGSTSIANRLGLSEFTVGVAILSIGSDLPELTIAINGAIRNLQPGVSSSDVVIGSALGSALSQIGFVLGLVGLVVHLTLPRQIVCRHGSIMIGALIVLALVGIDGIVSRSEGAALVTIYIVYIIFLLTEKTRMCTNDASEQSLTVFRSWFFLLLGLGIVIAGAELTVRSATQVADALTINPAFVAIIIIGLGTSLPELSISVGAAVKKRNGLSVGNLIGSNVFDTLVPIGVAATISTLKFDRTMLCIDLPFLLLLSSIVLFFFARSRGLHKREAAIVLTLYCGYALLRISSA